MDSSQLSILPVPSYRIAHKIWQTCDNDGFIPEILEMFLRDQREDNDKKFITYEESKPIGMIIVNKQKVPTFYSFSGVSSEEELLSYLGGVESIKLKLEFDYVQSMGPDAGYRLSKRVDNSFSSIINGGLYLQEDGFCERGLPEDPKILEKLILSSLSLDLTRQTHSLRVEPLIHMAYEKLEFKPEEFQNFEFSQLLGKPSKMLRWYQL